MNLQTLIPVASILSAVLCAFLFFRISGSFFSALFSTRFSRGKHALRERFQNIFAPSKKRGLSLVIAVSIVTASMGGCFAFTTARTEDTGSSSAPVSVSSTVSLSDGSTVQAAKGTVELSQSTAVFSLEKLLKAEYAPEEYDTCIDVTPEIIFMNSEYRFVQYSSKKRLHLYAKGKLFDLTPENSHSATLLSAALADLNGDGMNEVYWSLQGTFGDFAKQTTVAGLYDPSTEAVQMFDFRPLNAQILCSEDGKSLSLWNAKFFSGLDKPTYQRDSLGTVIEYRNGKIQLGEKRNDAFSLPDKLAPEGTEPLKNDTIPAGYEYLSGKTFTDLVCFGQQYLLLDEKGTIWCSGNGPSVIFTLVKNQQLPFPEPIVQMEKLLFVGKSGTLYLYFDAYQIDPYGAQSGKNMKSKLLTIPFGKSIQKIVPFGCNDYLLLTTDGECYTVGEMSLFGECHENAPTPDSKALYTPVKLTLPERLTDAFSNGFRLYVLSASGAVYQAPIFRYDNSGEGIYSVWSETDTATLPLKRSTQVFHRIPLEVTAATLSSPGFFETVNGFTDFIITDASGIAYAVTSPWNNGAWPTELAPNSIIPIRLDGKKIVSVVSTESMFWGQLCFFLTEDNECYASGIMNGLWKTENYGSPKKLPWGKVFDFTYYGNGILFRDEQGRLRYYGSDDVGFLNTKSTVGLPDEVTWLNLTLPLQ